jgi:DNA-binding NarL/FixJ family response regulator
VYRNVQTSLKGQDETVIERATAQARLEAIQPGREAGSGQRLSGGTRDKKQIPETAIFILSSHADKHFVEEAMKVVRAYVPKSKIGQALAECFRGCNERGRVYLP